MAKGKSSRISVIESLQAISVRLVGIFLVTHFLSHPFLPSVSKFVFYLLFSLSANNLLAAPLNQFLKKSMFHEDTIWPKVSLTTVSKRQ